MGAGTPLGAGTAATLFPAQMAPVILPGRLDDALRGCHDSFEALGMVPLLCHPSPCPPGKQLTPALSQKGDELVLPWLRDPESQRVQHDWLWQIQSEITHLLVMLGSEGLM
ncbi:hypothetical protein STEG23_022624 [Scotinomys teguina]